MSLSRRIGLAVAAAAALAGGMVLFPVVSARQQPTNAGSPNQLTGQSRTELPDGRWLLLGGAASGGAIASGVLFDPRTGQSTPLPASMAVPRTEHAATVMPDGSVLVVGGRNGNGVVPFVERFNADTLTFTTVPITGSVPRAAHTATLLTDGRVLVIGGNTGGPVPAPTELWDLQTQTATALPGATVAREQHMATLLADGRVLATGGRAPTGSGSVAPLIVDAATMTVLPVTSMPSADDAAPSVAAVSPAPGSDEVPIDSRIVVRFSKPVRIETLTHDTVGLTGPDGDLATIVVGAESGRLAFVWPLDPLEEGTTYTLTVHDAIDARGVPITTASVSFTTAKRRSTADAPDEEAWAPTTDGGKGRWRSDRPPSPWETLSPLVAPPGVSAVSGRVLRLDGRPLPDVTLSMEGRTTRTDKTGRFLLPVEGLETGEHTLAIDSRTANRPNRTYGFYEARIGAYAGRTNVLPFTIWSPVLDTAHQLSISSPTTTETVVTTPTMPGLELHLPAGTVITDEEHQVVRTLTLTPIPLDRTPFGLPADATFTMFFTIQPGGAYISTPGPIRGAWLVYPNTGDSPEGKRVQFFNYDPDDKGWFPYGLGTVTGKSVVPDKTTRIYGFTGASFNDGEPPYPGTGPEDDNDGDPVDPSTGAFLMTKTDLFLPDVMPLALTRKYNSQDSYSRAFGIGMTQLYDVIEYSSNFPAEADVYQPNGPRLHYARISDPNLAWYLTVLEHSTSNTPFYKSRLTFWGSPIGYGGWQLTRKDGTVYVFGHQAPLQAIRDRYGNETRLTWSSTNFFGVGVGNLVRITSPSGRWIALTYDANNRVTQAADNIGRTVSYTYDASGRLSTVTDAENNVTTYTWDTSNRILTITDGRNIVYLTNEYTNGRVTTQTLADPNASYQFSYTTDQAGNITQTDVTNPRGYVTRRSFNNDHYVTSRTEAVGTAVERTTTTERASGSNLVTATVDGLSRRTEYTYDAFGHVLTATRLAGTPEAVTAAYTYEPRFFQMASMTDPLNHTWTYSHDASGRLTGVADPLAHQTSFVMNSAGLVTSVTDALSHAWQFGYTGADLTSITDPLSQVTTRFVDAAGRLLSTIDPMGRVTRLTVDQLNRVTAATDPLGGQTSFGYDANSNLVSLTDALTHATAYAYDDNDRISARTDPLSHADAHAYDLNGNLSELTDRKGQVTSRMYDALDRLTEVTFDDSSTVAYTYDAGNRVTGISDSANGTITRIYDGVDRMTEEATSLGTVDYTYDAAGRRTGMTVAGQTAVSYGYDNANRLTGITRGSATITITYDSANRRSTLTHPNGIVATYGYDSASRLTSLTYSLGQTTLGDLTYAYDAAGNRTSVGGSWARTGIPSALSSVTYNAANQITSWDGSSFSYDANGNLTSDGPTSYTWNARNQLVGLSGGTSSSFAYDGVERRRTKTVGGTTTNLLYDGFNLVQELNGSGTPTANLLTGLGIDETFSRTDGSGTSALLTDALDSALALADGSGAVQTSYTYEPFGVTSASGTSSTNAAQFTGRENDGAGQYYFRARYYRPEVAAFISEDPLDNRQRSLAELNGYTYVANNPVTHRDPLGLAIWVCTRKAFSSWGPGNHAYFWDDTTGTCCGRGNTITCKERGPNRGDECNLVPGSPGKEPAVLNCCRNKADSGIWFPGLNDCHNAIDKCLAEKGLQNPGVPGGRFGQPCDRCK